MLLTVAALVALTAVALLPLLASIQRTGGGQDRRGAALALHRAQLAELGRERDGGRIAPGDYDAAVLEVQRRLLAADRLSEPVARPGTRAPLVAAILLLPVAAGLLYARGGRPDLPAEPLLARRAPVDPPDTETLVAALRQKLATADPSSDLARQGWLLLGNVEDRRGNLDAAAAAWRRAVAIRFDPTLAVLAAEARSRVAGVVDADSRALLTRALAEAPADAPWREVAERRLRGTPP